MLLLLAALLWTTAANAQTGTVVVAEGTATNGYVPVYGLYTDSYLRCQTIYPESMMSVISGAEISAITYYLSSPASAAYTGTFEVRIGICANASYSEAAYDNTTTLTTVWTGNLDCTGSTVTIPFDTPFTYTGGNLLIEVNCTTPGNYKSASYYGIESLGASLNGYSYSDLTSVSCNARAFIPKTGFTVPVSCGSPTLGTVTPDETSATIAWTETGSASQWSFRLNDGAWQTITTNPYTVTGLTSNTAYTFALRSICGTGDTSYAVSGSFRTSCGIQSVPYTEDFTGYTTYQTPDCWTAVQTYTSGSYTYPCVTSGGHEGNGLYVYGYNETSPTIIASPQLDRTVNSCYLAFDAKVGNYESAVFYPGIITNPADPTSFVAIDTIIGNQNNASSWTTYEYNLSTIAAIASSTSRYIAFKMDGDRDGVNIDNISITLPPSCDHPTIGTANASAEQAIISWTEAGSATQWSFRLNDGAWQTVTTNPYTVTGLTANTAYTYDIRSICGAGDTSTAVSGSFRTPCATEAFPYSEGFESYDANTFPSCWTSVSGSSTVVSAHASEGTKSLRISGIGTVASPLINIAGSDVFVTFDLECESLSSSGDMVVGVAMSPSMIDATVWIDTIDPTVEDELLHYEYTYINTLNVQSGCIVFKQINASSSYWYWLDNLVITTPPSCYRPDDVTLAAVSETSATITWTGNAAQYGVRINDGAEEIVTTTSKTFTDLTASTQYTFYVRGICGAGDTSEVNQLTFRTPCAAEAFPYSESFESYATGTGNFPDCWTSASNNHSEHVVDGHASEGNNSLMIYGPAFVASPIINIAGNDVYVSFDLEAESLTYSGDMAVGVALSPANLDATIWLDTIHPAEEDVQLPYEYIYTNTLNIQSGCVVFKQVNTTSTNWYYWLENLVVTTPPSCPKPTNLTADNATTTSITLSWTSSASNFEIQYKRGNDEWQSTLATASPATINGLQSSSSYMFRIRAICGEGDSSEFTAAITAATECEIIAVTPANPFYESFDGLTDGLPACWETEGSDPDVVWNFSTYGQGGVLYFEDWAGENAILMTPMFDFSAITNGAQLRLSYMNDDNISLDFLYRTSSTDEWTTIPNVSITSGTSAFTEVEIAMPNSTAAATYQIGIKATGTYGYSYYYGIVDYVYVEQVPTCLVPTNFTASAITETSATLSWTSDAPAFEVKYRSAGSTDWTTVTPNPTAPTANLTNLAHSTTYEVSIKGLCDGNDTSRALTTSFHTLCSTITTADLPYFEGFEGSDLGCWEQEDMGAVDYDDNPVEWEISNTYYTAAEGSTYASILGSEGESRLISPTFNLAGATNVTLTFAYNFTDWIGDVDSMAVEYRTSPTGAWQQLAFYNNATTDFQTATFPLTDVSATFQFAFHAYLGYGHGVAIDSVSLTAEGGVACATPTNVTATNATEGSVVVSWNGSASQYELEVTNTAAGTTTTYTTTASPYTVAGLSSETAYSVKVRALCDGGVTSSWSASVSFSTTAPAPCNTPTGLSVTNRAGNNITIAWEGTAAQYEIEATNTRNNTVTNYTTTETTYMITGLSSGTTYSIRVRAICSANNTSEWTAPVEGTTAGQNGISDVEAANAIRIYPNPTSVSTTINIEGVNGVVKIDIVDMNGRIIKSETTGCNNGCTKQIEVADMAKGAYFVRVSNDKLNVVRKLIVK